MKFIGHLDIMRYFRKPSEELIFRSLSQADFLHMMIMSFAAPLGVGVTSAGEYFDMELTDDSLSSKEMEKPVKCNNGRGNESDQCPPDPGRKSKCLHVIGGSS